MDKLDKLISDHAYEVYITNDLPDDEQDKEQLRLHDIYKQAIEAYIAETKDFRKLREQLKITQQDMAAFLGVSRLTYIGYEKDPDIIPLGRYKAVVKELERLEELKSNERVKDE